jgi:DNA-binding CsgD family transcriptional regulator
MTSTLTRGRWPLTGRDHELGTLIHALRRTGVVVIVGAPGVGKTRLAREVALRVSPPLWPPWWAHGTSAAREVPLAPFGRWLHAPAPAGHTVEGTTLQRLLDALGGRGPQAVLGIDDAHLLDGASATVLHQLALRRRIRLIVTVRAGEPCPDAVSALWKDDWALRWDLDPLDESGTAALVEAALGGPLDAMTRRRLHASTQGNALWLRHLVDGERDAGRLAPADGMWVWSGDPVIRPELRELVAAELGELSPGVQRVLELLTFGEPLGLDLVLRLADDLAVEEAAERGLVSVRSEELRTQVWLAHPLYGEIVRSRIDPRRARTLRGELAAEFGATSSRRAGDGLRRAVLGLDSDRPADADLLIASASQAGMLGDLSLAERLFRAGVDAGGGFEAQMGLAHVVGRLMRPEDADVELRRAIAVADTDDRRTRAVLATVNNLYVLLARTDEGWTVLEQAQRDTPPGRARADLDGIRAVLELSADHLDTARRLAWSVLEDPEASVPARAWAGFAAVAHRSLVGQGEPVEEVARLAMQAAAASPETASMQATIGFLETLALGLAGHLRPARERARQVRERPGEFAATFGALYEGRVAFHAGQVRTSAHRLAAVVPSFPGYGGGWREWLELMVTQALAAAGDAAGARAALARARAAEHPGMALFAPERGLAEAWTVAAEGAAGDAIVLAGRAAQQAAASGQRAMEVLIRHTAVCFGDVGQAGPLATLQRSVEGPRVALAARHARHLADADAEGLLAVSADLEGIDLLLIAADAAAQAAAIEHAAGRAGHAATAATRATALARRCERALTPTLRVVGSLVALSAREREVAVLAGKGLANRQIATRLHLSVRTVESHIYRACARLGLADRSGLAAVVAADLGRRRPDDVRS